jgi:hypothetical protein
LFDRSQHQPVSRRDDHERGASVRQAAEVLFAPRRELSKESIGEDAPPAGASVRKPRVFAITPTAPIHQEERELPITLKDPVTPKISRSQFARIRTWARYGMTAHQVADVYGVAVGEIEGILRKGA